MTKFGFEDPYVTLSERISEVAFVLNFERLVHWAMDERNQEHRDEPNDFHSGLDNREEWDKLVNFSTSWTEYALETVASMLLSEVFDKMILETGKHYFVRYLSMLVYLKNGLRGFWRGFLGQHREDESISRRRWKVFLRRV
jgi:hypothetical protein